MTAGRPTKYDPAFCDQIPELMQKGLAIEEVAAEIGIAKSTLYKWSDKYPKFSDAIKKGSELSKAWWMKQGREALRERDFNAGLWFMNMKNRHKWSDKREDSVTHNIPPGLTINFVRSDNARDQPA